MKIAVYHNLPSGGGKRTLQEQIKRLASKHQIDVFTLSSADHDFADLRPYINRHQVLELRELPLLDSPYGRLNPLIRMINLLQVKRVNARIVRMVQKGSYDVFFIHPCRFETAPSVLQKNQKVKSVYYCHEPLRLSYEKMPYRPYDGTDLIHRRILNRIDPVLSLYQQYIRTNDRRNTRHASQVLVNSDFTRRSVNSIYGIDAKVSYHGIDSDLFKPLMIEKQNSLLSVGSLTPLKGHDFLIRAAALIPLTPKPILLIVSNFQNAPERAYLESLAAQLGVRVEFQSNINDNQLVERYNQALITLYAPIREPFGLVPLESMACSTPVVAVNEGGVQETILDGITGVLTGREPQQFAEAIQRLLDDPKKSHDLGRNGFERVVNHWTWEKAITCLEQYLLAA